MTTVVELKKWEEFLKEVQTRFQNCPDVKSTDKYLKFKVGECPKLPWDGRYFRRFSSNVSGSFNKADTYIQQVFDIAKKHFGERVQLWDESKWDGINPPYGWLEVYEADDNYRAEMQRKEGKKERSAVAAT